MPPKRPRRWRWPGRSARRCAQRAGALVRHIGTRDAARDLDVVRAVLGDQRLHYLGKSYGTFLGATYAELFPARVGRLVLDGALDPAATGPEINRAQAVGFETALGAFVDDCLGRSRCPLPAPREAALAAVGDLLARTDRAPLPGAGDRVVTEAHAVLGIAASLYDKGSWVALRQALAEAQEGRGRILLLLADLYTDRKRDGTYDGNSNDAIYAVNCLDRPYRPDVATVEREAADLAVVSPRFGRFVAWSSLPCTYWPAPATSRPHRITAVGAAPILVVGTQRDPATPVQWARSLAGQLQSGVLLLWDGDGHTAYRRGSGCVDAAVDRYLLDAQPPADGTRCS
jgi:pimeloyl-ACP methyl ester carboxylesterase